MKTCENHGVEGCTYCEPGKQEPVADLVERLRIEPCLFDGVPAVRMNSSPEGEWVRYSDHASALASEDADNAALRKERDEWRKVVGDIAASVAVPDIIRATGTTADLITYFKGLAIRVDETQSEAADLRERVRVLEEALRLYGSHSKYCSRPARPDCDCGWDEMHHKLLEAKTDG